MKKKRGFIVRVLKEASFPLVFLSMVVFIALFESEQNVLLRTIYLVLTMTSVGWIGWKLKLHL